MIRYFTNITRQHTIKYLQCHIIKLNQLTKMNIIQHLNSFVPRLTGQSYRVQWDIFSGTVPYGIFGSFKTWCNATDWKNEMNNYGSVTMDYLQRLFRSRSWQTLIPDFENHVITSGYGTLDSKDYVASARTSNGNTIIAYLPSKRTVTVDMSNIQGEKAKCWWYNPSNGKAIVSGTYNNFGFRSFTPDSEGDWVLVIDNASMKLPAPGSQ